MNPLRELTMRETWWMRQWRVRGRIESIMAARRLPVIARQLAEMRGR